LLSSAALAAAVAFISVKRIPLAPASANVSPISLPIPLPAWTRSANLKSQFSGAVTNSGDDSKAIEGHMCHDVPRLSVLQVKKDRTLRWTRLLYSSIYLFSVVG
jgi:hypothetical protein